MVGWHQVPHIPPACCCSSLTSGTVQFLSLPGWLLGAQDKALQCPWKLNCADKLDVLSKEQFQQVWSSPQSVPPVMDCPWLFVSVLELGVGVYWDWLQSHWGLPKQRSWYLCLCSGLKNKGNTTTLGTFIYLQILLLFCLLGMLIYYKGLDTANILYSVVNNALWRTRNSIDCKLKKGTFCEIPFYRVSFWKIS